ncbi:ABC transporter substrate-binding protein [Tardiphaga sp.]|jgi:sulfonate transport system substrate-binding protein|uniref:ABC transporter substrate-binding protein n=1 Tax=Tardiphaga sp. TaxID=1926292 RepID=UPI0037DA4231
MTSPTTRETNAFQRGISRRKILQSALAVGATIGAPGILRAAPPVIRYATAGGLGPNETETIIFTEYMRKNVLKRIDKDYTLDVTYTRATPEAASMLAAGQVDMGIMTPPVFATSVVKNAVPNGLKIVADCFQDGRDGYASQAFFVLDDSSIKTVADLKGKTIAVNAYGSTPDVVLNVMLAKNGLSARKDLKVVEIAFPNIGAALRAKRVDCGVLPLPFGATEAAKGGIRPLFAGKDVLPPYSVTMQVATNDILKKSPDAVKAYLADYVDALHWLYAPENRKKAVEFTADLVKSPPEVLDAYFLTSKDYYRDKNACVTPALVQTLADAMTKDGLLPRSINMADYIDTSYLPFPC